jgi:amino acid transporter
VAADVATVLILITAFASVLAGLPGRSRVPCNAARDKVFCPVFGRLHPRHDFPHIALLVMGVITAIGSLFTLTTIIDMLTAVIVIVQAVALIVVLTVLRRRRATQRGQLAPAFTGPVRRPGQGAGALEPRADRLPHPDGAQQRRAVAAQ